MSDLNHELEVNVDPAMWGKHLWVFLHAMSVAYPNQPDTPTMASCRQFIYALRHLLPCSMCRLHFETLLKTHPPQVQCRQDLKQWVLDAHNSVNKRLGKPRLWTMADVDQVYLQEHYEVHEESDDHHLHLAQEIEPVVHQVAQSTTVVVKTPIVNKAHSPFGATKPATIVPKPILSPAHPPFANTTALSQMKLNNMRTLQRRQTQIQMVQQQRQQQRQQRQRQQMQQPKHLPSTSSTAPKSIVPMKKNGQGNSGGGCGCSRRNANHQASSRVGRLNSVPVKPTK